MKNLVHLTDLISPRMCGMLDVAGLMIILVEFNTLILRPQP